MTVWQIWFVFLIAKMLIMPGLLISPDEAYYFAWARNLQLSYFDHPPAVAWIMWLGKPFWHTFWGARLPGVIIAHLSFIPWIFLLRQLKFTESAIRLWLLLLFLNPLTGLGSFIVTPDVPLAVFWSLGAYVLYQVSEKPSLKLWIQLGLVVGLGLLSKYVMVVFVLAGVYWLVTEKKEILVNNVGFWLAVITSLIVFLPVLIWNYQNEFASIKFQIDHGLSSEKMDLSWPLEYLSAQFGLLNPFLAIGVMVGVYKKYSFNRYLTVLAAVPLLFFFLTSFRGRVEANWPICAYPAFTALAVSLYYEAKDNVLIHRLTQLGLSILVVACTLVVSHTVKPWLPIPKNLDRSFTLREWQDDLLALKEVHPLFARNYQMASWLSYYRPDDRQVYKLSGINRKDFYDYLPESNPPGKAFMVFQEGDTNLPSIKERFNFERIKDLPSGQVLYSIEARK